MKMVLVPEKDLDRIMDNFISCEFNIERWADKLETIDLSEEVNWWKTVDKENKYLIQLYSGMFGTHEKRVAQLYIIRRSFNFEKKINYENTSRIK